MNFANRVKDTTTTVGTGPLTLAGTPPSGFQAFGSGFSAGQTLGYSISDQSGNWEVGVGTLTNATTLARTAVESSSNANALVNFGSGAKDVFATVLASQANALLPAASPRTSVVSETLVLTDNNNVIRGNSASALVYTIPNDASVAWPDQAIVTLYQMGAGAVSFAAGAGVTLRSPAGLPAPVQYSLSTAIRIAANEWALT